MLESGSSPTQIVIVSRSYNGVFVGERKVKIKIWVLFAISLLAMIYAGFSDHRCWWMAATWTIGVFTGVLISNIEKRQKPPDKG